MTAAHGATPERGPDRATGQAERGATAPAARPGPRRVDRSELGAGIVVALLGIAFFLETLRIQRTGDVVGPETLPAIVGIGLAVLGLLLVVSAFRRHVPTPEELMEQAVAEAPARAGTGQGTGPGTAAGTPAGSSAGTSVGDEPAGDDLAGGDRTGDDATGDLPAEGPAPTPVAARVLLNFAIFFGYLFIFIPVGFLLSTAVFLFAMTCLYNRRRWVRNLIFSVVFSAVIYFAFRDGLGVFLPPGILG